MESIRQWCVLIGLPSLIVLLVIATNRIYKTNRTVTFDVIMIGAECVRVAMMLIYDFAYDHLIMLLLVFFVETILRSIVCSNFVSKVLIIKGFTQRKVYIFQLVYYFIITIVIIGIFVLALVKKTAITCSNRKIYSWHWFIMDGIDLF